MFDVYKRSLQGQHFLQLDTEEVTLFVVSRLYKKKKKKVIFGLLIFRERKERESGGDAVLAAEPEVQGGGAGPEPTPLITLTHTF